MRICGHGDAVDVIVQEAQQVVDSEFQLKFQIPTNDELRRLRHLHCDRPAEQEASVRRNTSRLISFLEAVDRGDMDVNDLSDDVQARLAQLQQETPVTTTRALRQGLDALSVALLDTGLALEINCLTVDARRVTWQLRRTTGPFLEQRRHAT